MVKNIEKALKSAIKMLRAPLPSDPKLHKKDDKALLTKTNKLEAVLEKSSVKRRPF